MTKELWILFWDLGIRWPLWKEEDELLGMAEAVVEKGRHEVASSLLGKLLTSKPFNRNVFKDTISELW